jgi:hypothetical protein
MPKIYQAYYRDSKDLFSRHHGASQVKVEAEARRTAKETGLRVTVDVLEIEKPSVKSVISMLNGDGPTARSTICVFEPTKQVTKTAKDGQASRVWQVRRQKKEQE